MGCDSSESNFNNLIFDKGQWWATTGWDYSYTGPLLEVMKKLPEAVAPTFVRNDWRWSLIQVDQNTWTAKPLGKESELAERDRLDALGALVVNVDPLEYWASNA